MAIWELVPSGSLSKRLTIVQSLGASPDVYGDLFVYDRARPEPRQRFRGRGLTDSELQSYKDVILQPNATTTLVDKLGTSHTGIPEDLSWSQDDGLNGTDKFAVDLTLFETT